MIKEQIKKITLTWEDYPLLMGSQKLGIMIIALDNGDYLKGAICYTETDNFVVGIYDEKWDKSEFTPFLGEITLKNDL